MNCHYADILALSPKPPIWFDEAAVPRFVAFHPSHSANIYAKQIVLLKIRCQDCGRAFKVCMSWSHMDQILGRHAAPLDEQIREKSIHYGDPPNVDCCPAGPTMNSEPDRVLEFWRTSMGPERYVRDPSLEVSVEDEEGSDR